MSILTWRAAIERALYGEDGFYRRGECPSAHFRTSVHASTRYAEAFHRLLLRVDAALGHPPRLDLVDIGAGTGDLISRIVALADPALAVRLNLIAVEVTARPPALPRTIAWLPDLPDEITGLVVANEWLDNIPLDVIEFTADGLRTMLVDPATGAEIPGPRPSEDDLAWMKRWWPLTDPGDRAEIGRPRCRAWASVISRLRSGLAVAVDYGHELPGRPPYGTLTGYRDGHVVPPIPDGSCDVTAHVAMDACASAGTDAGATHTLMTTQRAALQALGLAATRPPLDLARSDPRAYLTALSAAGETAELLDPSGLGGFTWLLQSVTIPIPLAPDTAC